MPGIFLEAFSGHFSEDFPINTREKPGDKSREKIRQLKNKNCRRMFLPKTDPNKSKQNSTHVIMNVREEKFGYQYQVPPPRSFDGPKVGSAKTDPDRFKWGFGEGLLKDKFAFFEAYESPIPKRRKLLAKHPFL